jgi:cytochrome c-type biogenesis protein CcmH
MTLILWVIFSGMVALAAAGLAIPLVRRYDAQARETDAVTAVLRDQLNEVGTQAASGQVAAGEADALRTEIKRRLLVEHRAQALPVRLMANPAAGRAATALAVVVALGATGVYAVIGRPDLTAPAPPRVIAREIAAIDAPAAGPTAAAPATPVVAPVIAQLEARMAKSPGDPEGWRMLGWAYFQTQRFADAATAYVKALKLDPRGAGYASAYGEALVNAAGGVVTPAAVQAFADAKKLDATDARARYFLALARDQAGDHKGAIDDWVRLLNEAPAGAPWAPELRRFVETAAQDAKIDLAGRLAAAAPSAPPILAGAANARGPSAGDVATVGALPPAAQQAFIRGMVDNLAAKLKANPKDADGWIRLIRAYTVLGNKPAAQGALRDGSTALADQPAMRATLTAAAASMGVS